MCKLWVEQGWECGRDPAKCTGSLGGNERRVQDTPKSCFRIYPEKLPAKEEACEEHICLRITNPVSQAICSSSYFFYKQVFKILSHRIVMKMERMVLSQERREIGYDCILETSLVYWRSWWTSKKICALQVIFSEDM